MFRSSEDTGVIYTSDDLVLFRESPFAAWMERLTLENPDHGIQPDRDSPYTGEHPDDLQDIVATLREEGRDVAVVEAGDSPGEHGHNTEVAMRSGADFIVGAYLSDGVLAARAGLLMRTSGFSDFGDHLYIPCEARPVDKRHSAFRLCVLADLLHAAQGQLPPQMLIISETAELAALQTEDHIYYYRAVKARFLRSMAEFRKHRMPDPAESAFFGRWAGCAAEVLKQRAERDLAQDASADEIPLDSFEDEAVVEEIVVELPRVQAAGGGVDSVYVSDNFEARAETARSSEESAPATLAEQASMLKADSFRTQAPGHTPNLARVAPLRPVPAPVATGDGADAVSEQSPALAPADDEPIDMARRVSDLALQNLEFIGSGPAALMGREPLVEVPGPGIAASTPAPDSSLGARESFEPESPWPEPAPEPAPEQSLSRRAPLPDLEPREPLLMPPEPALVDVPVAADKPHPLDSGEQAPRPESMIDMDSAPAPTLSPVGSRGAAESVTQADEDEPAMNPPRPFSSSLRTGDEIEDIDQP